MRRIFRLATGGSVVLALFIGAQTAVPSQGVIKAHADIQGAPGFALTGTVRLLQSNDGIIPTVQVIVEIDGLAPSTVHGIHIHDIGSCTTTVNNFDGAGGHFDPGPFGESNPDSNHPFHMGDLAPIEVNANGKVDYRHRTSRITLSPGPLSIFDTDGSAIIIHLNPDQGITGAPGSGLSGGPRIGCGVIQLDQ